MRRGPIEIYRDILLSVAMSKDYTEKPTKIMHKANLSWAPLNKFLSRMVEFGMIELLDSEGNPVFEERVAPDDHSIPKQKRRSIYLYRVSTKGFVILRIMDLLFEYVEAASTVNVPPALMRIIARTSGPGHDSFNAVMSEMIKEEMRARAGGEGGTKNTIVRRLSSP